MKFFFYEQIRIRIQTMTTDEFFFDVIWYVNRLLTTFFINDDVVGVNVTNVFAVFFLFFLAKSINNFCHFLFSLLVYLFDQKHFSGK